MSDNLTEHFTRAEMACRCGCGMIPTAEFMAWLQNVRRTFDHPMPITSGARCRTHNAAIGGAEQSAHMDGLAADVAVAGTAALRLIGAAILWGVKGVGIKQHGGEHLVHLDLGSRETPTVWTYP